MLSQRYKQLVGRCALLFIAGTVLQLWVGALDPTFLFYPWSVCVAMMYVYLLICLYVYENKWSWVKCLYDRPSFLCSLASLLVLSLIFGLVRQDGSEGGLWGWLGFTRMSASWTFNLFLIHFMTVLGLRTVDDVYRWKKRKKPVIVMHAAFFIILLSALIGSGEKVRVSVDTSLGMPVGQGVTASGKVVALPYTLMLKEFALEEYPPRIYRVMEGEEAPRFVVVDGKEPVPMLDEWQLECLDYLDMAGRTPDEKGYKPMQHVGATTAVHIRARKPSTGETAEGWISCGSHIFEGSSLALPDGSTLVMPRREVKSYRSRIELFTKDGNFPFDIRVNHPATIGAWKIYQSGYDSSRGKWSTTSVLECVRDGWYISIQAAMWMILAAGVSMLFMGWQKKKEDSL